MQTSILYRNWKTNRQRCLQWQLFTCRGRFRSQIQLELWSRWSGDSWTNRRSRGIPEGCRKGRDINWALDTPPLSRLFRSGWRAHVKCDSFLLLLVFLFYLCILWLLLFSLVFPRQFLLVFVLFQVSQMVNTVLRERAEAFGNNARMGV